MAEPRVFLEGHFRLAGAHCPTAGPGGAVGLHHMMSTRKTGEDMRWAAYAFWKAAEANREVRNGARSRAAGGSQVVAAQAAPTPCAAQSASTLSLAWACGAGTAVP